MPEVRVTRVGPSAWETYREVRLAMLADAPRAFGQTYAAAVARTPEDWRERLTSPNWFAHTADEVAGPEHVLGAVGTYRFPEQTARETCVVAMWVRPGARGRGVGEALLDAVRRAALADGLDRVTLDVAEENEPARRLYERCGFTPTGRTGVLPNDPTITELEMALDLSVRPGQGPDLAGRSGGSSERVLP